MYEVYDASPEFLAMLVESATLRRANAADAPASRFNVRAAIGNFLFGGTFVVTAAASAALFVPTFFGR